MTNKKRQMMESKLSALKKMAPKLIFISSYGNSEQALKFAPKPVTRIGHFQKGWQQ
jgi:hypothetical protein